MLIRNVSGDGREIAETGEYVEAGGTVEVTGDLAKRLLAQESNWKRADSPKSRDNESE